MLKRKSLVLPSGAECKIRPLSTFDFAASGVNAPDTTSVPKETKEGEAPDAKALEFGLKVSRLALLKACGALIIAGRCWPIVDKPHYACGQQEMTIEDIEQADAEMIIKEVLAMSGMGKEAAQAAQNFPEAQAAGVDAAPVG